MTKKHRRTSAGDLIPLPHANLLAARARWDSRAATTHSQARNLDLAAPALVYRGDTRPPREVFQTGFGKTNYNTEIEDHSGKILNGVSTSLEITIVRRKYAFRGGYIYAIHVQSGFDCSSHGPHGAYNSLEEINALYISTTNIIAAAGPVVANASQQFAERLMVEELVENPACTAPSVIRQQADRALRAVVDFRPAKTQEAPF